jgi:hypothetical protein
VTENVEKMPMVRHMLSALKVLICRVADPDPHYFWKLDPHYSENVCTDVFERNSYFIDVMNFIHMIFLSVFHDVCSLFFIPFYDFCRVLVQFFL